MLGRIQGKKGCGRPRTMFLDWLLKMEEATIGYEVLNTNTNNNTNICKAHIVSMRAESEAPAVARWRGWLVVVV